MNNKVRCLICNKEFKQITSSHLKIHQLTVAEYKKLYPNCKIVSNDISILLSEKCKIQNKYKNFGFKDNHLINKDKIPWNKGLNKNNDYRVAEYSNKLNGRKFSIEHRCKLSKSLKSAYKNGKMNARGNKNGMYGKKLTLEHKIKLLNSSKFNFKMNKPESIVFKTLKQYGFKYTGNHTFWLTFKNGQHKNPDFILPGMKIAVEVFGDYWHRNDNPNDLIELYKQIGWQCIVIWEKDVNNFCPDVFEQILNIFESEEFSYEDFNGKWMY